MPRRLRSRSTSATGPGRFALPVGDRDQFFGPVSPHAHDDQDTETGLLKADVEVDSVGPQVDVVDLFRER